MSGGGAEATSVTTDSTTPESSTTSAHEIMVFMTDLTTSRVVESRARMIVSWIDR